MIPDPLIGKQLANYRVERLLGRGGMAVVYFGRDVKLGRPAAIKVIDTRFRDQPAYAQRFIQEARTVASWRHNNIVQIYYSDDEDGLYFYAMEYIDGQNLAELMAQYRAAGELIPQEDVLRAGQAIAQALDYAHSRGVIHRDVKPSNIFIERGGRVVLGDFGLALDIHQGSVGEVFGTAHYMAPEQAQRSNAAVPQSDLYSLGVILYEMLTGVVPFDDPSPSSVAIQHITTAPPAPRSLNPTISPTVEAVLLKALSKTPSGRYPSGAALISALQDAFEASPADSTLPPPTLGFSQETLADKVAALSGGYSPEGFPPTPVYPPTRPGAPKERTVLIATLGGCSLLLMLFCLFAGLLAASPLLGPTALVRLATVTPTGWVDPAVTESVAALAATESEPAPTTPPTAPVLSPVITNPLGTLPAPTSPPTNAPAAPPTDPPPTAPSQPEAPKPTVLYPEGRRFMLYYNEASFYLLHVSGGNSPISPIAFERMDKNDVVLNTFPGRRWAEFYPTTRAGKCMRIEIPGESPYLRPQQCGDQYMSTRTPPRDDTTIFWTPQPGSNQFRVVWQGEEVGRCEIDAGECEVFLP